MVRGMCEIFKDQIFQDFVIHINDIIIFSDAYDEHVATLRKFLTMTPLGEDLVEG